MDNMSVKTATAGEAIDHLMSGGIIVAHIPDRYAQILRFTPKRGLEKAYTSDSRLRDWDSFRWGAGTLLSATKWEIVTDWDRDPAPPEPPPLADRLYEAIVSVLEDTHG